MMYWSGGGGSADGGSIENSPFGEFSIGYCIIIILVPIYYYYIYQYINTYILLLYIPI